MGLINSKDTLEKDQHNCWAHLRIARKDASQGCFKELFSTMAGGFKLNLKLMDLRDDANTKGLDYKACVTHSYTVASIL